MKESTEVQAKKVRKQRSDKGKKRGSYKAKAMAEAAATAGSSANR